MTANISDSVTRIVILNISGIYAHIHDQGYFDENDVADISREYADTTKWRVVVLD